MIKSVFDPRRSMSFKFGRTRALVQLPRLKFSDYLHPRLPPAPPCDYGANAQAVLAQTLANNEFGCCTASGAFHIDGVMLANAGYPTTWPDSLVLEFYERFGFDPHDPSNTDNGANEQDVLNSWQTKGLLPDGSHAIDGWLDVDATNPDEYRQAIYLFENLYFGVELPMAWISPFPTMSGFIWDVAGDRDPENGHCFIGFARPAGGGIEISTWGMTGLITDAAIAKYASSLDGSGELHVVISQDALVRATKKAPQGIDWDSLVKDFTAMGGHVAAS